MPATPWSSSSSLASDRILPRQPPKQQQRKGKAKSKAATPELLPSKSQAVRALEARLDGARGSNGHAKDTKGGCFCQARTHALSSYVPMCRRCGLILCALNPPYYSCPHCVTSLLDERERAALVGRLEDELAAQLGREEAERQRAIEEARMAEGQFPTLPGLQAQAAKTSSGTHTPSAVPTTRTVLSLNSGTKKVTVSSYSTPTVTSRPASREEDREEEGRVCRPPGKVNYVKEPLDPERPWRDVRAGDVRYVPLSGEGSSKRRTRGGERGAATTRND